MRLHLDALEDLLRNVQELKTFRAKQGTPFSTDTRKQLDSAIQKQDVEQIYKALEPEVFLEVTINPEGRVKVARGQADVPLKQTKTSYAIVRVTNQSGANQRLRAFGTYTGADKSPFELSIYVEGKWSADLTGQMIEYKLLQIQCSEVGKRELTIGFDAGQGTQDLGFRGEIPVLFEIHEPRRK